MSIKKKLIGFLAFFLCAIFLTGAAFGESSYIMSYINLDDGSTNPEADSINFIAYYDGDDSKIHTEDSFNDLNNNSGYVDSSGVCMVSPLQMANDQGGQSYIIWISYDGVEGTQGGNTSLASVSNNTVDYTTPGEYVNQYDLATANFLETPQNVAAAPGDEGALITWDEVAGADSYSIYHRPADGEGASEIVFEKAADVSDGSTTYAVISGLTNGTTYYFIMVAKDGTSRISGHNDEISVTPTSSNVPNITGPTEGSPGEEITVTGTGFGGTTGTVYVNGVEATINSWSSTSIDITIHVDTPVESGYLSVVRGDNGNEGSIAFTVNPADSDPPEISSTIPTDGATDVDIGDTVTIIFDEDMDTSSVSISCSPDPGGWGIGAWTGDTEVEYTHSDFDYGTEYTITVSGDDLAGNALTGDVDFSFETEQDTPVISSVAWQIDGDENYVYGTLIVTGTSFGSDPGDGNASSSTFNVEIDGIQIEDFRPAAGTGIYYWSDTEIQVGVPKNVGADYLVAGTLDLTVTSNSITSLPDTFDLNPRIYSIDPDAGQTGDSIEITGTAFGTVAGDIGIKFTPGPTPFAPSSADNDTLTFTVPSGTPGTKNVFLIIDSNVSNTETFDLLAAFSITTTSLSDGIVGTAYSDTVSATGGLTPYSWSISAGTLPDGLSINASTGVISGTPTAGGVFSFTVQAEDDLGDIDTQALSITIYDELEITTTSLADGLLGSAYSETVSATGGQTPYDFTIVAGALPSGLSIAAATGIISGTPTADGLFSFTVQVEDNMGTTDTQALSIDIVGAPNIDSIAWQIDGNENYVYGTITITGTDFGADPGDGNADSASFNVEMDGITIEDFRPAAGVGIYYWSDTEIQVGVPQNVGVDYLVAGTVDVVVTANSLNSNTDTYDLNPRIYALDPDAGQIGDSIDITGTAFGTNASAITVTFDTVSTTADTADNDTLTVTVPSGISGTVDVTLTIGGNTSNTESFEVLDTLEITTTSLDDGNVGMAYSDTVSATGGQTPYTYTVSTGALPDGLSLAASTGIISGTPTADGSFSFTIQVEDNLGDTDTQSLSIDINAELVITTTTLDDGTVGTAYSDTVSATGGQTPYTYTISAGSLPTGLSLAASGIISGTPTANGSFNFTVKVEDNLLDYDTQSLSIDINPELVITTTTLDDGIVGTAYSDTVSATGGDGSYTWSISSGALPSGLTIASGTGVISGTPDTAETASFTVQVDDGLGETDTQALSITIAYATPAIDSIVWQVDADEGYVYGTLTVSGSGFGNDPGDGNASSSSFNITMDGIQIEDFRPASGVGIYYWSDTEITVGVPPNVGTDYLVAGTINLTVTANSLTSAPDTFDLNPRIYALDPASGQIGDSIDITGTAFGTNASAITVTFGSVSTTADTANNDTLSVTVPSGISGTVNVALIIGGNASNSESFEVLDVLAITTTSLDYGIVGTSYSETVSATGGDGSYTWSVISGALPSGLSLNSSTGLISGTPTAAETESFTIQVEDGLGDTDTQALTITIYDVLEITTTSLANGTVGMAYNELLSATGGDSVYTWSVISGTLPAGLSLGATGTISGTPTATGTSSFTIQVEDGEGETDTQSLSITIYNTLTITTTSLPYGIVGTAYSETVSATGGDGSYTWSISSGTLPLGLSLNAGTGVISGTPTANGTSSFTIQVQDGEGETDDQSLSITIYDAVEITTSSLDDGTIGNAYSDTVSATGGDGSYTWSLISGALPSGLSLNSGTGVISGTPTATGTSSFTIQVQDGEGETDDQALAITIYDTLTITTSSLDDGTVGTAYSETVSASGGEAPYTWSIISGALPSGLSLDSGTGVISGTPTAAETATFTIQVEDNLSQTDTQALSITIAYATPTISSIVWQAGDDSGYVYGSLTITGSNFDADPGDGNAASDSFNVEMDGIRLEDHRPDSGIGVYYWSDTEIVVGVPPNVGADYLVAGDISLTVTANSVISSPDTFDLSPRIYGIDPASGQIGDSIEISGTAYGTNAAAITVTFDTIATTADTADNDTLTVTVPSGISGTVDVTLTIGGYTSNSDSFEVLDVLEITTTSLDNGTVGTAYSETVSATGGDGSYTWSVISGALPSGLSLNSSTGVISGTPTAAETASFTLQVEDGLGDTDTQALTITIYDVLEITTTSLANGTVGTAYSETVSATGGDGSYTWSVISGALPAGLSLNSSTGVISGTPTATGTSTFTIQVEDGEGSTDDQALSITIYDTVTITTTSLSDGTVGTAYSETVSATGGDGSYTWSVISGALPAGLSLNSSTGVISGTPTAAETASFTIQVEDGEGSTDDQALSITIYDVLEITTTSLDNGTIGNAYSDTVSATGGDGSYTWSVISGALPAGLSLNSGTGVISGTPTAAETASFTIQVEDGEGVTDDQALSITIYGSLTITTTSLADGTIGTAYSDTVSASGGDEPYTWSIISGALPSGLSLDAGTGIISGTPDTPETATFTIQVEDDMAVTDTQELSITIAYATPTISDITWQADDDAGYVYGTITITGSNFDADPGDGNAASDSFNVEMDGIRLEDHRPDSGIGVYYWSDTEIVVGVPPNVGADYLVAGDVSLTVTANNVTSSPDTFDLSPRIYGLDPASGEMGDSIEISGTAYGTNAAAITVTFDTIVTTADTADNDTLTVTVPAGLTEGDIDVTVTIGSYTSNAVTFEIVSADTIISNIAITRDGDDVGDSVTATWDTDPSGAGVDLYTVSTDFSGDAVDWTLESSNIITGTYTDTTNTVGNGTHKYYKLIPTGDTLADTDLDSDVVGKFDYSILEGSNMVSLPLIPDDEDLDVVIGTQLTEGTPLTADTIYYYDAEAVGFVSAYLSSSTSTWSGSLSNMEADKGYFINRQTGHGSTYVSVVGDLSFDSSRSIDLYSGSNMTGTAFPATIDFDDSGVKDELTSGTPITADAIYYYDAATSSYYSAYYSSATGNFESGSGLESFEPGKGYYVNNQVLINDPDPDEWDYVNP